MQRRSRNQEDRYQSSSNRDLNRPMSGRGNFSNEYQSDFGRDRSQRNQWSPSSDYDRSESRSSSRYGTSDSYRGQGRDLHYDETGRGYGDSHRNPGDYDDRSHRFSGRNDELDMERPEHLGDRYTGRSNRSDRSNRHDSYEVYGSQRNPQRGSQTYSQQYGSGSRSGYGSNYGNSYESGRGFDTESRRYNMDDQGYSRQNVSRDYSGRYSQEDVNRPLRGRNRDWSSGQDRGEIDRDLYDESERSNRSRGERFY